MLGDTQMKVKMEKREIPAKRKVSFGYSADLCTNDTIAIYSITTSPIA